MGDVCCLDKQPQENRILDLFKMVNSDSASNKYLHKKFKKVATLEDPSPPKKDSASIYSLPSEESDDATPLQPTSPPPNNNIVVYEGNQLPGTAASGGGPVVGGRYVCPYCKLSCAKPSVLRKHIRAHTNERPYPCLPCGFAFKTKSNLYKHCRSRAHTLKADGQSSDDDDTSQASLIEIANKPYKPKFHLSELSDSTVSNATNSPPFSSSPSPDLLNVHINKLITENQAIVEDSEWAPTFRKHSPIPSPPLKNGDSKLLELALTNYHPSEPEDLSSSTSAEPLNLTLKEPRKRSISETFHFIHEVKELPVKTKDRIDLSRIVDEVLHHCPHCKVVFRTVENLNTHLYSCKPKTSPGPLLGRTPLVESFRDSVKKRRVDFNKLESVKQTAVKLFGGEVHILDSYSPETGFNRLQGRKESFVDQGLKKDTQVMTISKRGLHSVGGTIIQSESSEPPTCSAYPEKMILSLPHVAPPNLKVPGITTPIQFPQLRLSPALNPLTSITAFNPLTLPASTTLTPLKTPVGQYNGGVVTILHDGKAIPFVPGMPGPNSLLASPPPPALVTSNQPRPLVDTTVIVKANSLKSDQPKTIQMISRTVEATLEISLPNKTTVSEIKKSLVVQTTKAEVKERTFLRPSTLPLKPGTYTPKRQLTTPQHTNSLVSPETPRPRKSYGQLFLNGHAYTYLGLKCSTRMFFCTLNKPQPIYVPLSPDQYKVSMYSNWTICSDSSPTPPGLDTRRAMSCYDSRNRSGCFTVANKIKQDLITHSTYKSALPDPDKSIASAKASSDDEGDSVKKLRICEGGFESNEDYTYVRGRGRGKYVCKECGIRCKKPSMLKKHIRTHTDLRPYTCKYCAFSFKTKGNLTKHMKSKAHYKRCVELDISPVPTNLENCDDEESGKQDEWGTNEDDSEEEETDDEEDDEEDESEEEGDECKMEREAARSLLSLSEVTLETAQRQYMSAGLVSHCSRPRCYPYVLSTQSDLPQSSEKLAKADSWRVDMLSLTKDSRDVVVEIISSRPAIEISIPPDLVRPMDLSSKPGGQTPVIKSIGDQAVTLASICSTTEKLPTTPTTDYPEDSQLLHAYLTERALRDSKMKIQQQAERKRLLQEAKPTEDEPMKITESPPIKDEAEPDAIIPIVTCSASFRTPRDGVISPESPQPPSSIPKSKLKAEFMPPSSGPGLSFISSTEDGKSMCGVCNKVFNKPSQLRLHVNIHYFERPYRCESCAVSFRTKGHLQKHQRSLSHLNKVNMNSTFGTATTSNPRPFKCDDCKIAFRIHGHLAKHFRSKMHIMKLECLGKLPFGTYAELERSGVNMNDIDTTDCENSLESLQILAQKLYEKEGGTRPSNSITPQPVNESDERTTRLSESSSAGSDEDCATPLPEQLSSDSGVGRLSDGSRSLRENDVGVR